MRVLQVSKHYPPVKGGIESVAWELTEGLNRRGVPTDVLCSDRHWRGAVERTEAGYTVRRAGALGRLLSTSIAPSMGWHLAALARDREIVHLHMPDPMTAAAFRLVDPACRLVLHWHSDVVRQRHAMRLYAPLQTWMLRRADVIVATSEPYAATSQALRPFASKVRIVPIGISDHRPQADARQVSEIRRRYHGRRIVFALGRMTYYKGFDVLIEAAHRLPADCVLVIGGEGELLEPLRQRVNRTGLAGRVFLPGAIEAAELASHFQACDVFCMSSTVRSEAFGVAMLEAMAMGRPVVATAIEGSGVPWVNQHGCTGLNVEPGDAQALSGALLTVLSDEGLRRRMGDMARMRYEGCLNVDRMTDEVARIYQEISE